MRINWTYFKTILNHCDGKMIRQGFWVLADQCGYSLVSFLVSVLLARACAKDLFGTFVLAMNIAFLSKVVQRSLVTVPFSSFYPQCSPQYRSEYLSHSLIQHFAVTGLLVFVISIASLICLVLGQFSGTWPFLVSVLLFVFCSLTADYLRVLLITRSQYRLSLCISVLLQLGMTACLLLFYGWSRLNVVVTFMILGGGYGIYSLAVILWMRPGIRLSRPYFLKDVQRDFKQGKWILSTTIVNYVGLQPLPWITLLFWDTSVVATMGVLAMLICVLRPLVQAMTHYLTPRISEMVGVYGETRARIQTAFLMHALALMSFLFVMLIYLVGDPVVTWLYGPEYAGHRWALVLFATAIGLRMVDVPLRVLLVAVQRPRCLTQSSILACVVSLALAFVLIPRYAVVGIAWIHVIYNLIVCACNGIQALGIRYDSACYETPVSST